MISFIIPAYNSEKTIKACVESIQQSASISGFEIIVVNNNSSDRTGEIAEALGVKVLFVAERNRSKARNAGIHNARFPLIAFIDADVKLDPLWAISLSQLFSNPEVSGAQGAIVPEGDGEHPSLHIFRYKFSSWKTWGTFNSLNIMSSSTPLINTAACMYRKDILLAVGGFDEDLIRHEDNDLSKRVALTGKHFATSEQAIAKVFWQGNDWCDYILRAFEIGKTKNIFLAKWDPGQSHPLNFVHKQSINLKKFFQTGDIFWIQKGIIELAMDLGRTSNYFSYQTKDRTDRIDLKNQKPFSIIYFPHKLHVIKFNPSKVYELAPYHAQPFLYHEGLITKDDLYRKMKEITFEDFSEEKYQDILTELQHSGVL